MQAAAGESPRSHKQAPNRPLLIQWSLEMRSITLLTLYTFSMSILFVAYSFSLA